MSTNSKHARLIQRSNRIASTLLALGLVILAVLAVNSYLGF